MIARKNILRFFAGEGPGCPNLPYKKGLLSDDNTKCRSAR